MYLRQEKSMVDVLFSQNVAQSLMSLMQKRRYAPSIRYQMPLKVCSMLYFKQMFKRSRVADRWCPS